VTIARGVCRGLCPQLRACREWVLATGAGTVDGVAGGLTPDERTAIRRQRRQAASAGLP
jgi:Transcription factor WhiB